MEYVRLWRDNTYVPKLTLSIDSDVVARAKRYAESRGTSVSRLVEVYLDAVSRSRIPPDEDLPPIIRRLRRQLRKLSDTGTDRQTYQAYLERKYR
jgi:hypothetical protein